MIYLDNNATTQAAKEVRESMLPFMTEDYANPSSLHSAGQKVRRAVEEARMEIAGLLGARSEREIVFTSGGTESNFSAIRSALKTKPACKRMVTTQVEHSSVKNLMPALEQEGYEVISVGVQQNGALDFDSFEKALADDTALVSVMWANNETGVLFPMDRITEIVKPRGILLHVDAIQAVGKIPVCLRELPIDFLSVSGHKFHGPKGVGILYVREGNSFSPLFAGGRQERDRRAGTENVPGIIGIACALRLAVQSLPHFSSLISSLRDQLEAGLLREIPDSFVNGKGSPRIPNTLNITIPGIEAEALLIRLSEAGIAASSGSACLTGALEPSHVLQAMGLSKKLAQNSLRFSLSRSTTQDEIAQALKIVPRLVSELRELDQILSQKGSS